MAADGDAYNPEWLGTVEKYIAETLRVSHSDERIVMKTEPLLNLATSGFQGRLAHGPTASAEKLFRLAKEER